MVRQTFYNVAPSAARLTESLRDIGYDFATAVADVVDNSIAARATKVDIEITFDGEDSWVSITDDGEGMTPNGLLEALRYGSRRDYGRGDLGRYGLGLKTASLSQCRAVTVVTRPRGDGRRTTCRVIDLDIIAEQDEWVITEPSPGEDVSAGVKAVAGGGTLVKWRKLDRVLPEKQPSGGWARRRLDSLANKTAAHLGVVFHRFLADEAGSLVITVNGEKVLPWDPFAPNEPARKVLPAQSFEIPVGEGSGVVTLHRYVLPPRDQFSSSSEWERLSGPLNWNRQQGLYVYRAQRLVQWGGWNGIRGIDEHTKLARAALDFDADLDLAFNINVAKMRVSMPPSLKALLTRPIHQLCVLAEEAYRRSAKRPEEPAALISLDQLRRDVPTHRAPLPSAGLALRSAAMQAGEYAAWRRIAAVLRDQAPDVSASLGLDED